MNRLLALLLLCAAAPARAAVELVAGKVSAALPDASVSTATLAAGSVTSPKLAPDAVITEKILNGAITTAKLNSDLQSLIGSPAVADGAITTAKLAADAVTAAKIINASITTGKLSPGAFQIYVSSAITGYSITQTGAGPCTANVSSTMTVNVPAEIRRCRVCFRGSTTSNAGGSNDSWNFLMDGAFVSPYSASRAVVSEGDNVGGRPESIGGCSGRFAVSAGSRNFCFTPYANAGASECDSTTACIFEIECSFD